MRAIKPLLLSFSMLAFACGAAYAADEAKNKSTQAKPATPQASSSGSASSGASASAQYDFGKADKNKDGQLSRTEFNDMMKGSASAGASAKKDDQSQAKTPGAKMGDKPVTSK
jgi:hypothetical protein